MRHCTVCVCASRLASRLCVPGLGVRVCADGVVCGCGSRWTSRLCVFPPRCVCLCGWRGVCVCVPVRVTRRQSMTQGVCQADWIKCYGKLI